MADELVNDFLISDASRLSGLSRAMLDYLSREKVLTPSARGRRGRGCPRRYSFGDVVILRIIARLLRAGVSVKRLKVAFRALRRYHKEITPASFPAQYLVTDGHRVYLRDKSSLLDLDDTRQMSFLFVLELRDAHQEVLLAAARG
jgi:DNA-binding transcriptional MerR regulator